MINIETQHSPNSEEEGSNTKKTRARALAPYILNGICVLALVVFGVLYYVNVSRKGGEEAVAALTLTPAPATSGIANGSNQSDDDNKSGDNPGSNASNITEPTAVPDTPTPIPTNTPTPTFTPTPTPTPGLKELSREQDYYDTRKTTVLANIADGVYKEYDTKSYNWSFKRAKDHLPSGNWAQFDITEYDCFYLNPDVTDDDKVVYITLDCGYATKNTNQMLDIFKEKDVKVTFFCTKMFLEKSVDEVKRMREEGHCIGNHTSTHTKLTEMSNENVVEELAGFEERMYELTGYTPDPFFRCPSGTYSAQVLQIISDLGYSTYHWSIAYGDYDKDNQPGKDYVIDHINEYHHNGAVILMHNDSISNLEAMADVIDLLRAEGYRFGTLYEFMSDEN